MKRSPWPYAIICFFIVIAAINFTVLYLASTSNPGLIESNPYEEGTRFQEQVDALDRATLSGIELSYSVDRDHDFSHVRVGLRRGSESITSARVVASFRNPVHATRDFQVELLPEAQGYTTQVKEISGDWLVIFTVLWEGRKLRFDRSLSLGNPSEAAQ